MVTTVHPTIGGITVPQFPNGSSSLFYHIAITGISLVACQQESNIATPHTGKLTHHPVHTYHPTADMTFIPGDNACYYIFLHFFPIGLRHHIESQRQDIGRHSIVTIEYAVGVKNMRRLYRRSSLLNCQETGVEAVFDFCCILLEFLRLIFQTLQTGELGQHLRYLIIVGCSNQCSIRLAGRVLTVNQFR